MQLSREFRGAYGLDRWGFRLGIDLPIFKWTHGIVQGPAAALEQRRLETDAMKSRISREVEELVERLRPRGKELESYRQTSEPLAARAVELSERAVAAGQVDLLQSLTAYARRLSHQQTYLSKLLACIVAVVQSDQIILAADGLETHHGAPARTACKILAGEDGAVTMAGLVSDGNTGFSLPAIAQAALESEGGLRARVAVFEAVARAAFQDEIDQLRTRAPGLLAAVLFAGVDQGRPLVIRKSYEVTAEGKVEAGPQQEIGSLGTGRVLVFCEEAAQAMRLNPDLRRLDPADLARTLVEAEIQAQPADDPQVGWPIAVVKIGRSGLQWIQPGACTCPQQTIRLEVANR